MGRVVPCQPGLGREGVTTLARERRHSGGPVSSRPIPGCLARARATARGPPCGCHPGRVEPTISRECAHRVPLLTAARATTQKKSLHASERDTPRVRRMRARWRQRRRHWDRRRLVFVDETGVNLALTRTHGRAPRGVRVVGAVPQNYGRSLTVLGALAQRGIRAALLIQGATDGEVFRHFVQRVLLPTLRHGDIVVWDNLSAHKVAGAAEALATVGATQQYLPPYSPDYNPIEKAWSKVKTHLRAAGARTHRRLHGALKRALSQITKHDAAAWFAHCGFPLH